MTEQVCPFLGTLDTNNRRGPHVEFPSFENHCLAAGTPELILLGDQATYCLSRRLHKLPTLSQPEAAHRTRRWRSLCAVCQHGRRYVAAAPNAAAAAPGPGHARRSASTKPMAAGARWGKLGAGLIFLTVLLCGSLTAAYSGWEWVTRDLRPETAPAAST